MDGTPFGRYRLIEMLGRGGMGEVWRAYDPTMDRVVALKLLPPNLADDHVFQERFRREARAAAGLDNHHIVPVYDFGEIDGQLFVTMRLIKGRDLQALLEDGPLEPARAVGIIEQVASALHAAHRVNLVHRDVKPPNILIDDEDYAYLIDFGIARAAGETGLTGTGATIGTWAYMAPERFSTGLADARTDIYALTCVLHEALTAQRPFPGDSLEQLVVGHLTTPPPQPSVLGPGVPQAMDAVIATGLAKDPSQRYRTATDLATAARKALTTAYTPPPAPVPPRTQPVPDQTRPDPPATAPATFVAPTPPRPTPPPAPFVAPGPPRTPPRTPPRPTPPPAPFVAPGPPPAWAPRQGAPPHIGIPAPVQFQHPPGTGMPQRPAKRPYLIPTAVGVIAAIVALVIVVVVIVANSRRPESGSQTEQSTSTSVSQTTPLSPTVLPLADLRDPRGIAVDTSGTVYVADHDNNRVVKLAAGSTQQTVLPFSGLRNPEGVAVDGAGDVFVADFGNNRVVKLAAGSTSQTELPFTGLAHPVGVAIDSSGAVYVANNGNNRVVMLPSGSTAQTLLPFNVTYPDGVAVDSTGAVYVVDFGNKRVVKLAPGTTTQTVLPFTGLNGPEGIAVAASGAVYVVDENINSAIMLAAGSTQQTVLPFTGLNYPNGVAVDHNGAVYVADTRNNRVVKLPQS